MISKRVIVIMIVLAAAMLALIVYKAAKCHEISNHSTAPDEVTEGL